MRRLIRYRKYTKSWLQQEYINYKRSAEQIGNEIGTSPCTILRWLRYFNISVRTNSEAQKGKKASVVTRKKMSLSYKKRIPPNKGRKLPLEWRQKLSKATKDRPLTEEHKRKIGIGNTKSKDRFPYCVDCDKLLSRYGVKRCKPCFYKQNVGEKNPNWKGENVTTPEKTRIRASQEGIAWRIAIYERDKFTCQCCGEVGGGLNAHHILSFAKYPKVRFDINNGITLCKKCHKQLHKRKQIAKAS